MLWLFAAATLVRGGDPPCPGNCAVPYGKNSTERLTIKYSENTSAEPGAYLRCTSGPEFSCKGRDPTLGLCFYDTPDMGCLVPQLDTKKKPAAEVAVDVVWLQIADTKSISNFQKFLALNDKRANLTRETKRKRRQNLEYRVNRSAFIKKHPAVKVVSSDEYENYDFSKEAEAKNVQNGGSQGARVWTAGLSYLLESPIKGQIFIENTLLGHLTTDLTNNYTTDNKYQWPAGADKVPAYCNGITMKELMIKCREQMAIRRDGIRQTLISKCNSIDVSLYDDYTSDTQKARNINLRSAILDALPVHSDFWASEKTGREFRYSPSSAKPHLLTFGMAMASERLSFPDEIFATLLLSKMSLDGRAEFYKPQSMTRAAMNALKAIGGGRVAADLFMSLQDTEKFKLDIKNQSDTSYLHETFFSEKRKQNIPLTADEEDAIRVAKLALYSFKILSRVSIGNIDFYIAAYMYMVDNYKPLVADNSCNEKEFSYLVTCETIHIMFNNYSYQRGDKNSYVSQWDVLRNKASMPPAYFLIDDKYNIRHKYESTNRCSSIFNEDADYAWSSLLTYGNYAHLKRNSIHSDILDQLSKTVKVGASKLIHPTQVTAYGLDSYRSFERPRYLQNGWDGPWEKVSEAGYSPLRHMIEASQRAEEKRPKNCGDQPLKQALAVRQMNGISHAYGSQMDFREKARYYRENPDIFTNEVVYGVAKNNRDACPAWLNVLWNLNEEIVIFDKSSLVETGNFWGGHAWQPYERRYREMTHYRSMVDTYTSAPPNMVSDAPHAIHSFLPLLHVLTEENLMTKLSAVPDLDLVILLGSLAFLASNDEKNEVIPEEDFGTTFVSALSFATEEWLKPYTHYKHYEYPCRRSVGKENSSDPLDETAAPREEKKEISPTQTGKGEVSNGNHVAAWTVVLVELLSFIVIFLLIVLIK